MPGTKSKLNPSMASEGLCVSCGYRTSSIAIANCPDCGGSIGPARAKTGHKPPGWFSLPPMRYQRPYAWFVVMSVLDVMFTWTILVCGGTEVNAIADAVIAHAGSNGMILYKFCLVVLVIVLCEVIGRRRDRIARRLAEWSVAVTSVPILMSIYQLLID